MIDGVAPDVACTHPPDLIALSMPSPSSSPGILRSVTTTSTGLVRSVVERFAAALRDRHLVAGAAQADREELAHRLLVVDDQDLSHA